MCVRSLFCGVFLNVFSGFAIIFMRADCFTSLYSCSRVAVSYSQEPWVGLECLIGAFLSHTHLIGLCLKWYIVRYCSQLYNVMPQ